MKYLYHENAAMAALVFAGLRGARRALDRPFTTATWLAWRCTTVEGYASWALRKLCICHEASGSRCIDRPADVVRERCDKNQLCSDVERQSLNVAVLTASSRRAKRPADMSSVRRVGRSSLVPARPIASAFLAPSATGRSSFGSMTPWCQTRSMADGAAKRWGRMACCRPTPW